MLMTKYGRLVGLEDVTPHTLRHSFGKHALDAGAELVSVAALLGHQRLEATAIYTTPSQRDLEKVVEKLEQDGDARRANPFWHTLACTRIPACSSCIPSLVRLVHAL